MISKVKIYGNNPREVILLILDSYSTFIENTTLQGLKEALGDKYIKQDQIKEFLDQFEKASNIVLSDKDKLDFAKYNLLREITDYDSSTAVNQFSYNGINMWLNSNIRSGIVTRFTAEKALGKTETTLWINNVQLNVNIEKGMLLIFAVETYASACYDCTAKHKFNVEKLNTLDEVINYKYKDGYPKKLELNGE